MTANFVVDFPFQLCYPACIKNRRRNVKEIRGKQLGAFIAKALPQVRDTHVSNHCCSIVSEGDRAVRFKWQKRDFRCSSRLICYEYGFGLPPAPLVIVVNELTEELNQRLRAALK